MILMLEKNKDYIPVMNIFIGRCNMHLYLKFDYLIGYIMLISIIMQIRVKYAHN